MKKILIVDDSLFMRRILKELLENYPVPIEIHEADNKSDALDIIRNEKPDLALLDVVMKDSETEGLEILRELRREFPQMPVIMLTSVGQMSIINECNNLNVQNYIEKPFDRDLVLAEIKRFV